MSGADIGVPDGIRCLGDLSRVTVRRPEPHVVSEKLSERELQVLGLISQGKNNKEIASLLFVSEDTLKMHVKNILRKLQANDRIQAVVIAIRRGLLDA